MVIRIFHARVKPGRIADFEEAYQRILPELMKAPGIRTAELAQNLDDPEEEVAITFWETPEACQHFTEGKKYRSLVTQLLPLLDEVPNIKVYQVKAGLRSATLE
ncbi:MAG: antibiotic biosynthesis monooxygenase [Deinococcus sp.]|nr:antibiotic biosynthesis monooxygenase [Deinococcus sp.]